MKRMLALCIIIPILIVTSLPGKPPQPILAGGPVPDHYNEMHVAVRRLDNNQLMSEFWAKPRGSAVAFRESSVDYIYGGVTNTYAFDKSVHYITINQ